MLDARTALSPHLPKELVDALFVSFTDVEKEFRLRRWKTAELDAGHFVEAARRCLDHLLSGSYKPIGRALSSFDAKELLRLEGLSGDESLRMLIPRVLHAAYTIRNKRGVGHLGKISPSEGDATFILYAVKWTLAELVRVLSGATLAETQEAVSRILERRLSLLWKEGDLRQILDPKMPARDQVILLLYDHSPQNVLDLFAATKQSKLSAFKQVLRRLDENRLLAIDATTGVCIISPTGVQRAEEILTSATTSLDS